MEKVDRICVCALLLFFYNDNNKIWRKNVIQITEALTNKIQIIIII